MSYYAVTPHPERGNQAREQDIAPDQQREAVRMHVAQVTSNAAGVAPLSAGNTSTSPFFGGGLGRTRWQSQSCNNLVSWIRTSDLGGEEASSRVWFGMSNLCALRLRFATDSFVVVLRLRFVVKWCSACIGHGTTRLEKKCEGRVGSMPIVLAGDKGH
ncbi:hypothetical protein GALMADRAFT_242722 [Galerina marginata CBS 339.88]|uniref:Uncharacterized protein n=1 Tax=Galerina marginata (strain CBS 339.88) TaxID=685588 RepID=A0A067TKA3_GALM3|nr:hypothetical protein GALMADRAFT_242722 [Galerina marginata CBS 339.88]